MKEKNYYKLFTPDFTPKQMLEYGVFGGSYLGNTLKEYPSSWFKNAKISKKFDVKFHKNAKYALIEAHSLPNKYRYT